MLRPFKNRTQAGRVLASHLAGYANRTDLVVLPLPRGGVPVAFEVAQALDAPLDVFLVRKLGTPGQPELAVGAIAGGGVRVVNWPLVEYLGISDRVIDNIAARERQELERRERAYRDDRPPIEVRNRTIITDRRWTCHGIDDGRSNCCTEAATTRTNSSRGASCAGLNV